jgi:hypothetical protein
MKVMLLFLGLIAVVTSANADERLKRLDLTQARSLARVAAESSGFSTRSGFSLEDAELKQYPDFYFFSVLLPAEGAEGSSANYAVNKYTGEVWKPFGCHRVSSSRLSKLRQKLMKQLGLTKEELRQHQDDIPCL